MTKKCPGDYIEYVQLQLQLQLTLVNVVVGFAWGCFLFW